MRYLMRSAAAALVAACLGPASVVCAQSVPDFGLGDNYQSTRGQVAPDLGLADNYQATRGQVAPDFGLADNTYDYRLAEEDAAYFEGAFEERTTADVGGLLDGPDYQTDDASFNAWADTQTYFDPLRSPFVPDRLADEYDTDYTPAGGDLFDPLQSSFVPDRLADDYDTD